MRIQFTGTPLRQTIAFHVKCVKFFSEFNNLPANVASPDAHISRFRWLEGARFVFSSTVVGLALAFILQRWMAPAVAPVSASGSGYSEAVAKASPAVVSIFADKIVTEQQLGVVSDPTLQRFLGVTPVGPARERREQNLGSAVLVRSDGSMITNDHVIAGFDNIRAVLWDGRVVRASVIGRDAQSDLAVLKIDLENLPAVKFSDINQLRAGDVVLAIGNPYGFTQSVTSGIISALGRSDGNSSTFIQTDAAINVGNSGGALINTRGELVGINTAALDRVDAGIAVPGISFAIPADVVQSVFEAILRDGEVLRGWLGLLYDNRSVAAPDSRLKQVVMVLDLYQQGPALQAGFLPGDILDRANGTVIESARQLALLEANCQPGQAMTIAARREGLPFEVSVPCVRRPR
jgi:serine protease DegQ